MAIIRFDGKEKIPMPTFISKALVAGYNFIETMGMTMAAGRSFSKTFGDEYSKIILNESAVGVMHLKNPVGKTIHCSVINQDRS